LAGRVSTAEPDEQAESRHTPETLGSALAGHLAEPTPIEAILGRPVVGASWTASTATIAATY